MGQKNTKPTQEIDSDSEFDSESTQTENENVKLIVKEESLVPQVDNEILVKNIEDSLEKFENELSKAVEGQPFQNFVTEEAKKICNSLRLELKNVLCENRQLNVVLIGPSNWGKTTLLKALEGKVIKQPSKTTEKDTKWIELNQDLCVLDTCGSDGKFMNTSTLESNLEDKTPDIAIVVLSAHDLRSWSERKDEIESVLKTVFKYAKKAKSTLPSINQTEKSLPVVWVISKLDMAAVELNCRWKREQSIDEWKKSLKSSEKEILNTINSHIKEYFDKDLFSPTGEIINLISITSEDPESESNIGLDQLRDTISINSSLNTAITTNNKKRYEAKRRAMAMKIITSFSLIAGLVTILPLVDIPLSMLINKNMLLILESLRTNPEKKAEDFKNRHAISFGFSYVTRLAVLGICTLFKATLIGAAIAIPVGATAATSTTMAIGIHAYNYFTNDQEEK